MSEPASGLAASLADRYAIERKLGEGGMATVYLAHDVRHDRRVALKVLRPELAVVVGAERFLTEIRTTANLQHPHILPLFDSGEAGSFLFYVMPFVEGESLRERLDRERQLPVDEAVKIALGVAEALQYAHEQGVIHRDVKPANILLSRGQPLVADFGIALAVSQAGGGRITETGLSLGTPHYMSPEQATGERGLDPRADVYALGCVLYEMLLGEPPYAGPTAQSVLAKILTEDPRRITAIRRTVPKNVEAAVARALEKLPADRFESAEAFARALGDPGFRHEVERGIARAAGSTAAAGAVTRAPARRRGVLAGAWVGSVALAAAVSWVVATGKSVDAAGSGTTISRFTHTLAEGQAFTNTGTGRGLLAVSPDGSSVVFVADRQLYLRAMGELEARPVPGTEENPTTPFFSPDGEWIGYWTGFDNRLKKVAVRGGAPVALAQATNPFGASWASDGNVFFGQLDGIWRVAADGGTAELVIRTEPGEVAHGPELLPDGDHVLFTVARTSGGAGRWDEASVVVQSLSSGERRTLVGGSDARYVPTGHLVFAVGDALMAVRFDARTREVTGGQVPLASGVQRGSDASVNAGTANYGFSVNGTLAFVMGEAGGTSQRSLVWVDRAGGAEPVPRLERRAYAFPRLSPDGRRVAVADGGDVWVFDLGRGAGLLLTRDGVSSRPLWSPDGTMVGYISARAGGENVFVQPSDGSGTALQLTREEQNTHVDAWSADGATLLAHRHTRGTERIDLLAVSARDTLQPARALLDGDYQQDAAAFSPDGTWIAYRSNESGRPEVYITPYPGPGSRIPVSTDGGGEPVWGRNGELFYRSPDGRRMMTVEVTTAPELRVGEPRLLFEGVYETQPRANYDVTPDGQRFLMVSSAAAETGAAPPRPRIQIVLDWFEELRAGVP